MTVSDLNKIVVDRVTAPEDTVVKILREQDGEILVQILNKQVWLEKRKERYVPKDARVDFFPESNLDLADFQLPSGPFKLLMWIKSLQGNVFSGKHAERSINMADRTVRDNIKYLIAVGKINVETVAGKGYRVTMNEEKKQTH